MTVHRTRLQQPVTFLSAQQTGGVPGSCAAQAFPALMSTSACPSMLDWPARMMTLRGLAACTAVAAQSRAKVRRSGIQPRVVPKVPARARCPPFARGPGPGGRQPTSATRRLRWRLVVWRHALVARAAARRALFEPRRSSRTTGGGCRTTGGLLVAAALQRVDVSAGA
jgi:hypothetical protein